MREQSFARQALKIGDGVDIAPVTGLILTDWAQHISVQGHRLSTPVLARSRAARGPAPAFLRPASSILHPPVSSIVPAPPRNRGTTPWAARRPADDRPPELFAPGRPPGRRPGNSGNSRENRHFLSITINSSGFGADHMSASSALFSCGRGGQSEACRAVHFRAAERI